nr:hypothetical protein [uncultured Fluviicola sp.]
MKFSILILFFLYSQWLFSQGRNQHIREMNHIVELMNVFSRCNQTWYSDAVQLQKALNISKIALVFAFRFISDFQ